MPIKRDPIRVLTKILDHLQLAIEKTKQQQAVELKTLETKQQADGSSNSSQLQLELIIISIICSNMQFEMIKEELRDAKEVFPRVKNWEKFVTDEFDSIEQDLEDILDDCKDLKEFGDKFQSILAKVEKITKVIEKIQLQSINADNPDVPKTRQST
ncbi:hypothetical protein FRX31_016888, partial [Thalictrum thalictroides]